MEKKWTLQWKLGLSKGLEDYMYMCNVYIYIYTYSLKGNSDVEPYPLNGLNYVNKISQLTKHKPYSHEKTYKLKSKLLKGRLFMELYWGLL